ncbi:MAG: GNAT family N-acetyltransferase [Leptolyngbyaceae cyanobacterium CRU_2_3]|nr:GNAT family N-acetyltransferase [Leptolyngbyaceae cyanobacterium CRU_2_3]
MEGQILEGQILVRLHRDQTELGALLHQRWMVLRMPLGMVPGTERDKYDDTAWHGVAVHPQKGVIGSARLRLLSEEVGSIAYVSVLSEFQYQGVGTALVKLLIAIAQHKKLKTLRVMSRMDALKFYQRLGFTEQGIPQDYLGIPHQFMVLDLAQADCLQ